MKFQKSQKLQKLWNKRNKINKNVLIIQDQFWNIKRIIMEYQKIIRLVDNTPNQPTKFRIKNWIEINDDSRGRYNTIS